jgi:hypothetical protein
MDAYHERAAERRRSMVARVARSKDEAAAVTREFEAALDPAERPDAIWTLTCELALLRGMDESELRFDRSSARVERRRR